MLVLLLLVTLIRRVLNDILVLWWLYCANYHDNNDEIEKRDYHMNRELSRTDSIIFWVNMTHFQIKNPIKFCDMLKNKCLNHFQK